MLLHPLRLQILELAIEGTSGTDAARRLGLPRQMVNYHVLALEKAGLLVRIGETRRRNMVERRVRSSARSYIISPDILGPLSGARRRPTDPETPAALLSLAARVHSELGPAMVGAPPELTPLPVLSFSSKLRFSAESARASFVRELGEAVVRLLRDFAVRGAPGSSADQSYGFILGLYPLPRPVPPPSEGDQR